MNGITKRNMVRTRNNREMGGKMNKKKVMKEWWERRMGKEEWLRLLRGKKIKRIL